MIKIKIKKILENIKIYQMEKKMKILEKKNFGKKKMKEKKKLRKNRCPMKIMRK